MPVRFEAPRHHLLWLSTEKIHKSHLLWPCITGQIRSDAPSLLIDYSLTENPGIPKAVMCRSIYTRNVQMCNIMNCQLQMWLALIFVFLAGLVAAVWSCGWWHLCDSCLNPLWATSDSSSSGLDLNLNKPRVFTRWASNLTNTERRGKKVWISWAQWAHLTVLSAQRCYIDFLIFKQYGSTSRPEHVFRLPLEVALKQSVSSFDLDCLSESLSKTRLTWHHGKWQILYSHILFKEKKTKQFFKNMSDMMLFNSSLWFGSNKNFSTTVPLRLAAVIQQNSLYRKGALWTVSISVADRDLTGLHNFWQTLAARCGMSWLVSSVTFPQELDPDQKSPRSLMVPVWQPALICQLTQRLRFFKTCGALD